MTESNSLDSGSETSVGVVVSVLDPESSIPSSKANPAKVQHRITALNNGGPANEYPSLREQRILLWVALGKRWVQNPVGQSLDTKEETS